ncbi:DUF559 domain-containing protein [Luteimonas abyssi]|uniref:DUF559 domain-containing protein n=1 Tax=Luteimonas abyssi TaxID=1247514 RepID=UPI003CE4E611
MRGKGRKGNGVRRTECLGSAGFTVPKFWNDEIFKNAKGVIEVIMRALADQARTPPPPRPSLEGES